MVWFPLIRIQKSKTGFSLIFQGDASREHPPSAGTMAVGWLMVTRLMPWSIVNFIVPEQSRITGRTGAPFRLAHTNTIRTATRHIRLFNKFSMIYSSIWDVKLVY